VLLPVQGHGDQAPKARTRGQLPPSFLRPKEPLGFSALWDCRRGCHQPGPVLVPQQPPWPSREKPQGMARHYEGVALHTHSRALQPSREPGPSLFWTGSCGRLEKPHLVRKGCPAASRPVSGLCSAPAPQARREGTVLLAEPDAPS